MKNEEKDPTANYKKFHIFYKGKFLLQLSAKTKKSAWEYVNDELIKDIEGKRKFGQFKYDYEIEQLNKKIG